MKCFILIFLLLVTLNGISQRYKKIHQKAIVVDTHNDLLGAVVMTGMHLEDDLRGKAHSDFKRFKQGGVDVQVFSVFCDASFGKDTAFKFANIEIDSLYAIAARNAAKLEIVTTPGEMIRVVNTKKIAGIIGVEGGHMIEDNIQYLDSLYFRGARYLTLTWNNSTSWASSSMDETNDTIVVKKGLSEFGKNVVRRMNKLGMMIDISHVGEQTLADVLSISAKPVIASHSSVYAINPHHRNLKDDQIRSIAKNGGVIQVNFFPGFLDSNYYKMIPPFRIKHKSEQDSLEKIGWSNSQIGLLMKKKYAEELHNFIPGISAVFDHIDHIVNLVGIDHVGLGSDFDGIPYTPYQLEDVSTYPNITKGLLERGYTKRQVKKILGGNFIRVFKMNVGERR